MASLRDAEAVLLLQAVGQRARLVLAEAGIFANRWWFGGAKRKLPVRRLWERTWQMEINHNGSSAQR